MSSLSAAQADGYYIPPAYLDSGKFKKQSLSQFAGSKGHNQYLQRSVVRFELPYDGFCLGCQAHVGKGTRFNAHKAHVDDYFTTKIWEFTMKCRACAKMMFKIRTDPRERGFAYVSGIKKKVEEFDTVAAGTAGVIDTDFGNGIEQSGTDGADGGGAHNPLAKLEKSVVGERKAMTERDQMEALLKMNGEAMWDDAASNASLRATYRSARKAKKRRLRAATAVGLGKGIEMSDPTEEDISMARSVFRRSQTGDKRARMMEKESFSQLRSGSIFGKGSRGSSKVGIKQKSLSLKDPDISRVEAKCISSGLSNECASRDRNRQDISSRMPSSSSETKVEDKNGGVEEVEVTQHDDEKCTAEMSTLSALAVLADYGSDSD